MSARNYVLSLLAVGFGLFLSVVAANLLIDPQHVFGTNLLPRSPNANDRYERVVAYQAGPEKYDGLIFGSSRAFVFSFDDLAKRMGDVHLANFTVVGGMLTDHLAALKWALQVRPAGAPRMRAAFLLVDVDNFGNRPFTNQSNQYLMPPALSGDNPARFWWKNLVSIQFRAWRSALVGKRVASITSNARHALAIDRPGNVWSLAVASASAQTAHRGSAPDAPPAAAPAPEYEKITRGVGYQTQLSLLRQFVEMCRSHGIGLIVALSPLSRQITARLQPADLQAAIEDISRIVPIWDFTGFAALSDDHLWNDVAHFDETVAELMVRRMFGADLPQNWTGFGRRLPS